MQDAVTVHMAASPEAVWHLVSDVTQIGRFSPETFEAEWLDEATGPAVGVKFRGHVKRNQKGPIYWKICEVTESERGRVFEFVVFTSGKPSSTWRYEIAPAVDGVDVTESFHLTENLPLKLYWFLLGWARGKTNRDGMRATLERVKAVVEAA
jgi:hypothetical protein